MWSLSEEIYESKKQALEAGDEVVTKQIGHGKDIMSILSAFFYMYSIRLIANFLLVKGNMNAREDKLDEKEVIAQVRFTHPPQ